MRLFVRDVRRENAMVQRWSRQARPRYLGMGWNIFRTDHWLLPGAGPTRRLAGIPLN